MIGSPRTPRPGRDRRARRLRATPGRARAQSATAPRAAVVGGGIAGLTAATALAERGVRVTLYERDTRLGGRLAGWPTRLTDGTTVTMSRGFHAFFRQYYNLRALLRRTDPTLSRLTALPDYPLRHSAGREDSFRKVPRTPPLSALGFVALSESFGVRDLARIRPRAALPLLDVRVPEIYDRLDHTSAHDFLEAVRFPAAARHLAFEVFSRSFFADPRHLSAAEMALMFHIYFLGSAEGLLFDVPTEPFPQALWDPLAHRLDGLGAQVRTGEPVDEVHVSDQGAFTVTAAGTGTTGTTETTGTTRSTYDAVVLALDPSGLRALVARSGSLGDAAWRDRAARLRTAPPFLVSRLWLDRPVRADRPGFLGTSGYGPLDNVSVLSAWEGEAARWAARTGGSVLELHAYALPAKSEHRQIQDELLGALHRVYPETAAARVLDARHEWRADCPLFPVGGYLDRPAVRTPTDGLVVAGDTVRTGLPVALMERAATSGFLAANTLLARWGLKGHDLWTVPSRGRSAALRWAAERAG
ncbi:FAD-dependent oxidoreductase [Streptomyces sp. NPDC091377]|uniref:FAD-dependent oxidoreductase n=1 Tax=Streptomyces sp. NPDC091377 TaxID=3365995 RepID=UPI0037F3395A